MGSAASVAVPDQIHFADLLKLAPALVHTEDGTSVDINALRALFKKHRGADGFLSRENFVALVMEFSESAELRQSIVVHHQHISEADEKERLEEITEIHRFRDSPLYSQVHLMDYEVFKSHGSYPCFTEPITASTHHPDKLRFRFTCPADEIDFENAYVIFISHTWFRRDDSGAVVASVVSPVAHTPAGDSHGGLRINIPPREQPKDIHKNTHPDTINNEQYKLCLSGLHKFVTSHLTNFTKIYIWMDYCCLDLRPEAIEETLTKLPLSTIMSCCDCMFTPLLDDNTEWEYPAEIVHFYEDYNATPWSSGPGAYLNRAWCRMEMFYANHVPLMVDLTPDDIATYTTRYHSILVDGEKKHYLEEQLTDVNKLLSDEKFVHRNPFANVTIAALDSKLHSRRAKMSKRLRTRASSEQRPHVIYGSYEYRLGLPPLIVSPINNLYIDKYAPLAGYVSRLDDIVPKVPISTANASSDEHAHGTPHLPHDGTGRDSRNSAGSTPLSYSSSLGSASRTPASAHHAATPGQRSHAASPAIKLEVDYLKRSSLKIVMPKAIPSVLQRLNDELKILMDKGKVGYDGEMNEDGERHGRGIYTYANGEKYIGEWEHGKKQGCGYFKHQNGDIYNGEFHQDHAQGLCTMHYATGDAYFGELVHGKRSGHGLIEYKNGDIYEGDFKRGLRSGEGVMKYANGDVYTGQYHHDVRHGFGVLSDMYGQVKYHGPWKDDVQAPNFKPGEEKLPEDEDEDSGHHHHHKHHHHHHKHHHKHHHHPHSDGSAQEGDGPTAATEESEGQQTANTQEEPPSSVEDAAALAKAKKERQKQIQQLYASKKGSITTMDEVERTHRAALQQQKSFTKKKKLPSAAVETIAEEAEAHEGEKQVGKGKKEKVSGAHGGKVSHNGGGSGGAAAAGKKH